MTDRGEYESTDPVERAIEELDSVEENLQRDAQQFYERGLRGHRRDTQLRIATVATSVLTTVFVGLQVTHLGVWVDVPTILLAAATAILTGTNQVLRLN